MYKKVTLLLITAIITFIFLSPSPADASQVGTLVSLKGYVLVKNAGGDWQTPYLSMGIYDGDRIVVYNNSYAVISFYQDGHLEYIMWSGGEYYVAEVAYNSSYEIWGQGRISSVQESGSISVAGTGQISQKVGGVSGRPTVTFGITSTTIFYLNAFEKSFTSEELQKLSNSDLLNSATSLTREPLKEKLVEELGFTPEKADTIIKYTKVEASLSTMPEFYWKHAYHINPPEDKEVKTYVFKLSNGFKVETTDKKASYTGEELKRGELYTWTLETKEDNSEISDGVLYIISEEDMAVIDISKEQIEKQVAENPTDCTPYKLMGDYMLDLALYPEALEYYKKAQVINPDGIDIKTIGILENSLLETLLDNESKQNE